MWVIRWTTVLLALAASAFAQEKNGRVEARQYTIDANVNPRTQSINATVKVDFVALGAADTAVFQLNNALKISKVVDSSGQTLNAVREAQDSSVHIALLTPLTKGQSSSLTIT